MRHDGDDDYGLPRVDVVVPDDARELAADIAAWRREERRRLQRARLARLFRPLTRHGIAAPLIAGALVIALVSGGLMTFFGPRSHRPQPAVATATRPTNAPGRIGGSLPDATVVWNRQRHRATEMASALIAVVPHGCACAANLTRLADMIHESKQDAHLYLVADRRPADRGEPDRTVTAAHTELAGLARQAGTAILVDDPGTREEQFAELVGANGLTVLLVHGQGLILDVRSDLRQIPDLELDRLQGTT